MVKSTFFQVFLLERGKHAFTHTKKYHKAKGDVPSKSVLAYAERIGEGRTTIENNKNAYEVYKYCNEQKSIPWGILSELTAKHFRLIHPLPKKHWVLLAVKNV